MALESGMSQGLSTVIEITFRTSVIYLTIFIGLRLLGKREVGQMTVLDLVLILLLSNAVQNAMVGSDISIIGGITAAGTLLLINFLISKISLRWPSFRHLIEGDPLLLVLHGKTIPNHLKQIGLDEEILAEAVREHGLAAIDEVEMAVLEIDGSISIIPMKNSTIKNIKHKIRVRKNG